MLMKLVSVDMDMSVVDECGRELTSFVTSIYCPDLLNASKMRSRLQ